MTEKGKEAPATYELAAAEISRERASAEVRGRKGLVGGRRREKRDKRERN